MSTTRKRPRPRAVPRIPEVRFARAEGLEVRNATNSDEIIISGSPIVYNAPYEVTDIVGSFEERMMPGVAADVLSRGADVRFLVNHTGLPYARTASRTMVLSDGDRSLSFEARLSAASHAATDLADAIQRGDVSQMSCGFIVARDEWNDAMDQRTIYQFANLLDVSAVTYPASPTTSIQIAERMALEIPVESRARVRQLLVRAGKVLSGSNQDQIAQATRLLHGVLASGGFDPATLLDDQDGAEGDESDDAEGMSGSDGAGMRVADLQSEIAIRTKRRLDLATIGR